MRSETAETPDDRLGIADAIDRDPATTTPDRSLDEVALELIGRGLSGMPVLDADGRLVGIVSEYDLIAKRGRTVGEVMSRGVVSAAEDAEAAELAGLMGLHGIRLVPICRDERLVGVVDRGDLVRLFATTRWVCQACEAVERGLARPDRCAACGGTEFRLDRDRSAAPS
jgi:CBS domain-containing protein